MTSPRARTVLLTVVTVAVTAVTAAATIAFATTMEVTPEPGGTAAPVVEVTPKPVTPAPTPTLTPSPVLPTDSPSPGTSPTSESDRQTIERLLTEVTVLDSRPQVPGYERDCSPGDGCVFGPAWTDDTDAPEGHNGCDTRNDVLRRTLQDVAFKPGSNDCDVVAGHFVDPYTNVTMAYETEGSNIHIDHLFPLAAAWDLGAADWTQERREAFANDTELELLAVNGSANMAKGDSTPASWIPANKPFRCEYLARYLKVAVAYDLAITAADVNVITPALRKC